MDCAGSDIVCGVVGAVRSLWSLGGIDVVESVAKAKAAVVASRIDVKDIFSLIVASVGAYKWWNNREKVVFRRLHTILEEEDTRLRHARVDLLRTLHRPAPREHFSSPLYIESELKSVLDRRGWKQILRRATQLTKVDRLLTTALDNIQQREKLLRPALAMYQHQRFSAFVIQGAIASARAERTSSMQVRSALRATSIEKFQSARRVAGFTKDLDALEMLALQLMAQGHYDDARDICAKICDIAAEDESGSRRTEMQIVRARKVTAQCRFLEGTGLATANVELIQAAEKDLPIGTLIRRDQLDKAQLHELHSNVRFKLAFVNVGTASLMSAEDAYSILREQCKSRRKHRSSGAWQRLRAKIYQSERQLLMNEVNAGFARCAKIREANNLPPREATIPT
jgi:hypothetical protein